LDEIDSFARMLSAKNKEKYKRIKDFYPEATKYIRRYNKDHIENLKSKQGLFWKKSDFSSLSKKDKETII